MNDIEIVDRASFEQALELAIAASRRLKQERQGTFYWGVFPSAELQLHAIRYWMRDGRVPTPEQRASIDIHIRLARVFDRIDPNDFELRNYEDLLGGVALYATYLPSDELLARGEWRVPGILGELQDVRDRLRAMSAKDRRKLLELDDIPYPDQAGFPGQPKP